MSKKLPQKAEENKELSSYAGNLTKEFLIKVSLLDLSHLLSFSFFGFVSYSIFTPFSLLMHLSNANVSSLIGVTGHQDSSTSVTRMVELKVYEALHHQYIHVHQQRVSF